MWDRASLPTHSDVESANSSEAAYPEPLLPPSSLGTAWGRTRPLGLFPFLVSELGMFEMGSYESGARRSDFWTPREALHLDAPPEAPTSSGRTDAWSLLCCGSVTMFLPAASVVQCKGV